MQRYTCLLTVPFLVLVPLLVACDSGPPTINSGIETSKVLNALTDEDATTLCNATIEMATYMQEEMADADPCILLGLMLGALGGIGASSEAAAAEGAQEACEGMVEKCEQSGSNNQPMEMESEDTLVCDGSFRDKMGENCTATVGEYEACTNAMGVLIDDLFSNLSCTSDLSAMGAAGAECQVVTDKGCNLALTDSGNDSSSFDDIGADQENTDSDTEG